MRNGSKSATEDLIFMVWLLYLGKQEISASDSVAELPYKGGVR